MKSNNKFEPPVVSIILAVRNSETYLGDCIDSIVKQKYRDWELIIVVNSSTDQSLDIALKFQSIDRRIKVLQSDIGQLNFNLNLGLQSARGKLIARIDADDILCVDRLQIQVPLMKNYDVVGSVAELIDANSNVIGTSSVPQYNNQIRKKIFYRYVLSHPTVMIKKEILLAAGGYQGGQFCEDFDLWLRLMRNSKVKFHNIQRPLIKYRIHSHQMSSAKVGYPYVASYLFREAFFSNTIRYGIGSFIYLSKFLLTRKI